MAADCPTCGGTGRVTTPDPRDHAYHPRPDIETTCPTCDGTGKATP